MRMTFQKIIIAVVLLLALTMASLEMSDQESEEKEDLGTEVSRVETAPTYVSKTMDKLPDTSSSQKESPAQRNSKQMSPTKWAVFERVKNFDEEYESALSRDDIFDAAHLLYHKAFQTPQGRGAEEWAWSFIRSKVKDEPSLLSSSELADLFVATSISKGKNQETLALVKQNNPDHYEVMKPCYRFSNQLVQPQERLALELFENDFLDCVDSLQELNRFPDVTQYTIGFFRKILKKLGRQEAMKSLSRVREINSEISDVSQLKGMGNRQE